MAILVWACGYAWPLASRHKSKQALRDYQKVLVQLENLETGVGDQCRKEFTGVCVWIQVGGQGIYQA